MPGTDICLKIGGYVRAETTYHSNGSSSPGPLTGNVNNRNTNEWFMRARAYITADAREQTAWGTARAYVAVGVATTDVGNSLTPAILGFNRAFIQWAGITAGVTQSFWDFYSSAAMGYRAYGFSEDTGDAGWWVWAYTAQLGNGLSASISAEERRASQIIGLNQGGNLGTLVNAGLNINANATVAGGIAAAGTTTSGYGGIQSPDIVANIRLDQTWGSAQIMGAAHEVNSLYYGGSAGTICNAGIDGTAAPTCTGFSAVSSGHPGDQWGWAAGAGLRLNFPMIAQGDYFQSQVNYTQGALQYLVKSNAWTGGAQFERGNTYGFGVIADCVYASNAGPAATLFAPALNGTGCNLTTAWSVNAGYEHYWTPQFHESFIGGYFDVRYNGEANNNLCAFETGVGFIGTNAQPRAGCNNNWNAWFVATRLQYDFTKTLYLGVEVLYNKIDTAQLPGNTLTPAEILRIAPAGNGLQPGASIKDQDNIAITARIHKDFLP
jgi:Porin subfamily